MTRTFTILGAIFALTAVALGAFGAHALAAHFEANPTLEPTFETAARYHMYHALALFVAAWAATHWNSRYVRWAGYLFVVGLVLFSGSLYVLSIFNVRFMGAVAPFGGVALILGWGCVALAAYRGGE